MNVDHLFDHPAFSSLKDRASVFVVVHPGTRALIWANAAAAAFWDRSPETLAAALFGPPGRGWLGTAVGAVVPGRAPQMFRTALAPGLGMRGAMILARAISGADGSPVVGFAVPGSGIEGAPSESWRRGAAPDADASDPNTPVPDLPEPSLADMTSDGEDPGDADPGTSLARRSQLAVLRDRLVAATGGTATLRFLWRTDARGSLTQIDQRLSARLGAPLAVGSEALPEAVARFDAAAGGRLRDAFAARATWSSLAIRLPAAGGAAVVPVVFSGAPVFGRDRDFDGFRGFGIVDFAGLETRPRETPPSEAAPPTVLTEPEAQRPATTRESSTAAPAIPESDIRGTAEPLDAPDADVRSDQPPVPGGVEPDDPERAAFDNVVDLRSFQVVRSAPPPVPEAYPAELPAVAADPTASGPYSTSASDIAPSEDEPVSDEMAFLALGAALRAQIGENGVVAQTYDDVSRDSDAQLVASRQAPDGGPDAIRRPPAAVAAAVLLEELPVAILVLRSGEPAFANAAAARALAFDTPGDLVASGSRLVAEDPPSGLTLRNGRGEAVAVAAEPTPVDWEGAAAVLWTFGLPTAPPAADPVSVPHPDGDERPADLIDRVDDAVALLDGDGRIRRLNERGVTWFGASALGDAITALLAPESRGAALQLLEEARTRTEGSAAAPPRRDVLARTAEGAGLPVLLTLGRLGTAGFYATLRDVSALRRAERDGAQSRGERERDAGRLPDLLARVSHEIRTPLNAILGFAEVMMDERFGPLGNPRYREYLKDIHASGTQVVALVGDLLDLSRIEAGRLDLDVGAVDVNKVVAEIVGQMQAEANRGRVIVRTSLASRIPSVMADERSARQIVQHLLSNAVKFNEPGGQVIVSTTQDDGGAVLLRIRDTGVGMTEAEIAAALEPFHDVSPPRPANGNGLGLPLARALVGANGASLSIRSRPREGTLVEVSFPPVPSEEARLGA